VLSKILLAALLFLLVSKYGLRAKLKLLKPRLDRAVNFMIVALGALYAAHLIWWVIRSRQH
jgi:hypothetical protein